MTRNLILFVVVFISFSCSKDKKSNILSPTESIAAFEIEEGFEIKCIAHEPIVQDPVAIAFDDDGNMWVTEMNTYMPDANGIGENRPVSKVKILSDKNGDGNYETVKIFADSLILPRAVCPVYGGVLIAEPPYLWFYNINGKNRIVVDSFYAEGGNVEHQANGLILGMDNWIYSAKSDKRYRLYEGKWEKESTVYRGQWGIDQDEEGRLYYNHNSANLLGDQWSPNILPHLAIHFGDKIKKMFGQDMCSNRVYPMHSTLGVNRGYEKDVLDSFGKLRNATASCGISIYGGHQFDKKYKGNAFSCESSANLVKRIELRKEDEKVIGNFPYEEKEFLRTDDEKFRPVFSSNGPDGALYIVDIHRGIIQHSTYLTGYLRKHIDTMNLDQCKGYGRIYRIQQIDRPSKKIKISDYQKEQVVELLSHENKWVRLRAQWKIINDADKSLYEPLLKASYKRTENNITKLHILNILDHYKIYDNTILFDAVKSKHESQRHLILSMMAKSDQSSFIKARNKQNQRDEMAFVSIAVREYFATIGNNDEVSIFNDLIKEYNNDSLFAAIIAGEVWENSGAENINSLRNSVPKKSLLYKWLEKSPLQISKETEKLTHLSIGEKEMYREGKHFYSKYCEGCHGKNGEGISKIAPPLVNSEWVTATDKKVPVSILLNGISGPIKVAGKEYNFAGAMVGLRDNQTINDGTIAKIATYIRNSWGNAGTAISTEEVSKIRIAPPLDLSVVKLEREDDKGQLKNTSVKSMYLERRSSSAKNEKSTKIFNGKNLNGWSKTGGNAVYKVEDKVIKGSTNINTPNTFLIAKKKYADFILDLDVWIDTLLNSGIQIRSNMYPNYYNGVLHGYQIEIDPSARAWSGGLYDESRRGWLYSLKDKPIAQKAFIKNQWNHYRIEAIGPRIKTFINDIPVTDYIDSFTRSGYIGLQVHSIGKDIEKVGKEVKWKNIKLKDLGNVIWTASEEDKDNLLYYLYDDKSETHWKGKSLHLDLQNTKFKSISIHSLLPYTLMFSKNNKDWLEVKSNSKEYNLKIFKYVKIIGSESNDLSINEITFH